MFLQFISKQLLFPSFVCFSFIYQVPEEGWCSQPWQGLPRSKSSHGILEQTPGWHGGITSAGCSEPGHVKSVYLQLFLKWLRKKMEKYLKRGLLAPGVLNGTWSHVLPWRYTVQIGFAPLQVFKWVLRLKCQGTSPICYPSGECTLVCLLLLSTLGFPQCAEICPVPI